MCPIWNHHGNQGVGYRVQYSTTRPRVKETITAEDWHTYQLGRWGGVVSIPEHNVGVGRYVLPSIFRLHPVGPWSNSKLSLAALSVGSQVPLKRVERWSVTDKTNSLPSSLGTCYQSSEWSTLALPFQYMPKIQEGKGYCMYDKYCGVPGNPSPSLRGWRRHLQRCWSRRHCQCCCNILPETGPELPAAAHTALECLWHDTRRRGLTWRSSVYLLER